MTAPKNLQPTNRNDAKTLLATLKMTTMVGAVSLTLAGWGLLARVEALKANQSEPITAATTMFASARTVPSGTSADTRGLIAPDSLARATQTALAPTPTTAPTATAAPTVTTAPTVTPVIPTVIPATSIKLNVVQWTQTNTGDPIAVVQDDNGTLWYVWGPDVVQIEQGLDPQYQPIQVDRVARSRHS